MAKIFYTYIDLLLHTIFSGCDGNLFILKPFKGSL